MKLATIKIEQIAAGDNVRKDITQESLSSLIASIKDKGIIQPLLVRANGEGKYDLVAGYRRFTAAKHLKLADIPVLVADIESDSRTEYQITENLQRADLNPIDEAYAYKKLLETHKIDDVVVITGKSVARIKRITSLLNLDETLQEAVKKNELSMEHGVVISRLIDKKEQKEMLLRIKKKKLSAIQAESELERFAHELNNAQFDRAECKACQFNGSQYKDLFDKDNALTGRCLNNTCFSKKLNDHVAKTKAALEKEGKKVKVQLSAPEYGSKAYEEYKEAVQFGTYATQDLPKEVMESECFKTCPTMYHVIGPNGKVGQLCFNADCMKRKIKSAKAAEAKVKSIKSGKPEVDSHAAFELKQKENRVDEFKRLFYIAELKKRILPQQYARIMAHQTMLSECSGDETIAEALGMEKKKANWDLRGIETIEKMTQSQLEAFCRKLIVNRISSYDTKRIEDMAVEAGVNIGKEFIITKEYLDKFSKAGLEKLAKELKLKVGSLVWKEKKDAIIDILLKSGTKGKVPKELIK